MNHEHSQWHPSHTIEWADGNLQMNGDLGMATSPLHDNSKVWICCCDVDHLVDAVH